MLLQDLQWDGGDSRRLASNPVMVEASSRTLARVCFCSNCQKLLSWQLDMHHMSVWPSYSMARTRREHQKWQIRAAFSSQMRAASLWAHVTGVKIYLALLRSALGSSETDWCSNPCLLGDPQETTHLPDRSTSRCCGKWKHATYLVNLFLMTLLRGRLQTDHAATIYTAPITRGNTGDQGVFLNLDVKTASCEATVLQEPELQMWVDPSARSRSLFRCFLTPDSSLILLSAADIRRILLEKEENAVFYQQHFTSVYLQTEIITNLTLKDVKELSVGQTSSAGAHLASCTKGFWVLYENMQKIGEEMNTASGKSDPIPPTDFTAETWFGLSNVDKVLQIMCVISHSCVCSVQITSQLRLVPSEMI